LLGSNERDELPEWGAIWNAYRVKIADGFSIPSDEKR
jgi:hypothetical protein